MAAKQKKQPQSARFIEKAKELGLDGEPRKLDDAFDRLNTDQKQGKKSAKPKG